MKKNIFFFFCLLVGGSIELCAQDTPMPNSKQSNYELGLNSYFSYLMMEPNQNLRKVQVLMDSKADGMLPEKSLTLGFQMIGIMDYQNSNTNSKFGYLMRHPTSNNQIGETVSEAVVHSAHLSLTASLNSWVTAYGELLYDPQQSFGAGSITAIGRNQIQLRKGFITIGDLNKFPLYFALGKMDTPFGQTNSVSPFTNSTMWHAFGGLGYGALVGFDKYGINANISFIQGGAQFRALNVPVDSTAVPSQLNNFAADLNYTIEPVDGIKVQVGASYLKGSAYCQDFPVVHFTPCIESNAAFTYYGNITIKNRLYLKAGFAKTEDVWPGTFNPTPPLNQFAASKVSSLDYGAIYQVNKSGNIIYSLSYEFSNFKAGPEGSPWERQNQTVIGVNAQVQETSRFFLEFFRTAGYAPLNFISGGNFTDLGTTHSDRDVSSFGFVLGALLAI